MANSTVLRNLKRICRERGVSISSVGRVLRDRSGYVIDQIDMHAEDDDLRLAAQFVGVPLSQLVEGVEAHEDLYEKAVFEESYDQLHAAGHDLPPREQARFRVREAVEGHNLTKRGLREHMLLALDGLAGPSPEAREYCDPLNCDCVGRCKITGRRMDAAG